MCCLWCRNEKQITKLWKSRFQINEWEWSLCNAIGRHLNYHPWWVTSNQGCQRIIPTSISWLQISVKLGQGSSLLLMPRTFSPWLSWRLELFNNPKGQISLLSKGHLCFLRHRGSDVVLCWDSTAHSWVLIDSIMWTETNVQPNPVSLIKELSKATVWQNIPLTQWQTGKRKKGWLWS